MADGGSVPRDKLIMFDFDGVIADSLEDQSRAFVDTLRAHGLDELATRSAFLDFTETNWFEALAEADLPESVAVEIEEAFAATPIPDLFPEMAAVIGRLGAAHPVVVITSSRTADVEAVLDEHGVSGVAEVVGGDVEPSKTRKIRSARRRYGASREAWYVCDTVGDVHEARAAGAVTVGVAWGWHGEERLLRAEPDQMAQRPADLLDLF
jgi:phosphoglycolate phosphatase